MTKNRVNQNYNYSKVTLNINSDVWYRCQRLRKMSQNKVNWSKIAEDAFMEVLNNEQVMFLASLNQEVKTLEDLNRLEHAAMLMLLKLQKQYSDNVTDLYDAINHIKRSKEKYSENPKDLTVIDF